MTDEQLADAILKWQRRLRLADWEINAGFYPSKMFDHATGDIEWDEYHMVATIRLLQPDHGDHVGSFIEYDPEVILVHELLHLRLADSLPQIEEDIHLERAINSIAGALVDLDRAAFQTKQPKRSK